jgi:CheY-like chemotaxis protein
MHILIVDDIVINRYIIREIIRALGFEYKEADNGQKAIEYCKEYDFDIIFLDIEMPVMNGLETARQIRTSFTFPKNKVLIYALTAYNPSFIHDELNLDDFNGVVTKPFSLERIKEIIIKSVT